MQGLSTQVKQHLRYYQEFAAGPNTKGTKSTTVLHLSSLEPYGSTATVKYSSVLGTLAGLDSEHMLALLEHCRERQFLSTQQQQTLEEWLRELSNLSLSDLVFDEQQRTKSLSHLATSKGLSLEALSLRRARYQSNGSAFRKRLPRRSLQCTYAAVSVSNIQDNGAN